MRQSVCSTEYFPLTLALSLREREQEASDRCLADGRWANFGNGVVNPSPSPEGRGPGCGRVLLIQRFNQQNMDLTEWKRKKVFGLTLQRFRRQHR